MPEGLFGRILVAIDGSKYADRATDAAIDLAKKYGAELTVLAVAPVQAVFVSATEPWVPAEVPESENKAYREVVEQAVRRCQAAGVAAVTGICLEGVITDEIIGHVEKHPTDLLVLGSRGKSAAKRLLLGSVSDAVSHHVTCPVLIVRLGPDRAPPSA
ncbi:MAG TPA: universal stress protein [Thermoplasmata archaeon]|nr:universal stress protein [Thermoplasmata archaeon]